jgi:cytolysin-activating lysine-acyltransferase
MQHENASIVTILNDGPPTPEQREDPRHQQALRSGRSLAAKLPVLGHVAWLYMQSGMHRHFFVHDFETRVVPPLVLDQCRLFVGGDSGGLPVGFASWARFSEEAEQRYCATQRPKIDDWRSGDRLWLVDLVAPFGDRRTLLEQIRQAVGDDGARLLQPTASGTLGTMSLGELLREAAEATATGPATRH